MTRTFNKGDGGSSKAAGETSGHDLTVERGDGEVFLHGVERICFLDGRREARVVEGQQLILALEVGECACGQGRPRRGPDKPIGVPVYR